MEVELSLKEIYILKYALATTKQELKKQAKYNKNIFITKFAENINDISEINKITNRLQKIENEE